MQLLRTLERRHTATVKVRIEVLLTGDVIGATMEGRIKQVISGLLKGGQHEHAVLHLGNAKPGDAQHLALQRHPTHLKHHPYSVCYTTNHTSSSLLKLQIHHG